MRNITPDLWVETLRGHIGTRFRHQGRSAAGLDCVGLLVVSALELGIAGGAERIVKYKRHPDGDDFDRWVGKFTVQVPYNRLQPLRSQIQLGDLLTFWIEQEGVPRHIAAYTGVNDEGRDTMIHSYAQDARGVIEHVIDTKYWMRRISAVYRLKDFNEE